MGRGYQYVNWWRRGPHKLGWFNWKWQSEVGSSCIATMCSDKIRLAPLLWADVCMSRLCTAYRTRARSTDPSRRYLWCRSMPATRPDRCLSTSSSSTVYAALRDSRPTRYNPVRKSHECSPHAPLLRWFGQRKPGYGAIKRRRTNYQLPPDKIPTKRGRALSVNHFRL